MNGSPRNCRGESCILAQFGFVRMGGRFCLHGIRAASALSSLLQT